MRKFYSLILLITILFSFSIKAENKADKISLKEAIYQALENNLDLKIEKTNLEYSNETLKIGDSIFIPKLTVDAGSTERNRPTSDIFGGADIQNNESLSLNLGLEQKIALGGTLNISLYNSRSKTNNAFSTINPNLYSNLTFSLSQPLLKGFGTFSTKKDIYIAVNNYKINEYKLKENILEIIYNVEDAYWNLVYTYQNLDAKKKALQRSKDLLKQNEIKVRVGVAAPIDILEAKADVASYESQLIQAEQSIQTAEENLKKILNLSKQDKRIIPSDIPEVKTIETDFNKFLLEALQNRPDIEQSKLDLKNYNILVKYARNQMLPDLQLTASYYTTGQGGTQIIYGPGNPFTGEREIIGTLERDVWDSMKDTVSNLYKNYSFGLKLSVPLSFSKERAQFAQAKINMKRSLLNLEKVENNIYSEVKQVIKEIQTNLKLVVANDIALKLEKEKLKAEEKKLSVGLSTNFQVLTYQRQYAAAQTNALQSIINYNQTLAKINKILARTFKTYNIKFKDFLKE